MAHRDMNAPDPSGQQLGKRLLTSEHRVASEVLSLERKVVINEAHDGKRAVDSDGVQNDPTVTRGTQDGDLGQRLSALFHRALRWVVGFMARARRRAAVRLLTGSP